MLHSETCQDQTLNKQKTCIYRTLNKVPISEILINLTCLNQIPVYSVHKSLPKEVRFRQVFFVQVIFLMFGEFAIFLFKMALI